MDERLSVLVVQAQAGSREAFGKLYLQYRVQVIADLLRRGFNLQEAEDLCHDVFLNAFEKLSQLRCPFSFFSWLMTSTRRAGANFFERRKRAMPLPANNLLLGNSEPAMHADERIKIYRAFKALRPMDRDSLLAFYWNGNSIKEMAAEFKVPIGTVKRRLHTARHRLRAQLQKINGNGDL